MPHNDVLDGVFCARENVKYAYFNDYVNCFYFQYISPGGQLPFLCGTQKMCFSVVQPVIWHGTDTIYDYTRIFVEYEQECNHLLKELYA